MSPQPPSLAKADFHMLAKPTGAICNLDCKYCFFLSKEMLYPGSRFRMADDLLETYIRQLLESQASNEVIVGWQGGEPTLMGLPFFERSVELVEKYKKPGQQVSYTIQTNGTKLDDRWCRFLKKHKVLVGLSVDGPKALHDAYRVDKGGKGSFDDVMRGWRCLHDHGVDVNILCTVHAANADHPVEVYRFFRDELKTQFIQFIPIIERVTPQLLPIANKGWGERGSDPRPLYLLEGNQVTDRSVGSEQWGRFLIGVFDEWVKADVGKVYVQMFDAALASWVGAPPSMCIFYGDLRQRAGARAQRRRLLLRPLRRARLQAGQHPGGAPAAAGHLRAAAQVRPGQARHAAEVLPRLQRALRLPRRVPEEPLPHDAGRRSRV